VRTGISNQDATAGPTCPVSPSVARSPARIRSALSICLIASAKTFDVAQVSDPAKALSVSRIASSQPIASDSRSERSASSGPIEIVVTWAPNRSFSMSASSIAYRSRGLIMLSSPDRTIVPVSGSILTLSVSGTCFIRTMMCIEKLRIVSLTQEYDTKV